jgi:hypothetical protein
MARDFRLCVRKRSNGWSNDSLPPAPDDEEKMERSWCENHYVPGLQDVYRSDFFRKKSEKKVSQYLEYGGSSYLFLLLRSLILLGPTPARRWN